MHYLYGINTVADAMAVVALIFAVGWLKAWAVRNTPGEWVLGLATCTFLGLVVFWYAY